MDYKKLVDFRNTHNPFAQRLGIVVVEASLGYAKAEKTIDSRDTNPLNVAHGGIYFAMADVVSGTAMASHGYAAVTLGANYDFFCKANVGDVLTATAKEIKHGRTISVFDVQIFDGADKLLGKGTFSFYRLNEKIQL